MSVANLQAYALSQGITKSYDSMTQAEQATLRYNYLMSVSADAQGDFTRTQDSFANQLRIAKLNVQDLGATLGNMLLPVAQETVKSFNGVTEKLKVAFADPAVQESITKLATAIGELITKIANLVVDNLPQIIDGFTWILDNGNNIVGIIVTIGAAFVGFKTGLIIVTLISKVAEFFTLVKTGTGIMEAFNIVLGFNPIVLIIGLVVALVAAFIYFWNTSDDFRQFWIDLWDNISSFFIDIWEGIVSFFTETIPNAFNAVIEFFVGIQDWFLQLWVSIGQCFIDGWNAIVSFFTETIPLWITSIITWFGELPTNIGYMLGYLLGCFVNGLLAIWNFITVTIPAIVVSIITWFASLPEQIWNWLVQTIVNITLWGIQMYQAATTWVNDTVNGIISWFSQLPGRIWDWLVSTITNIIQWGIDLNAKANQAAADTVNGIIDWFSDLPGNMLDIGYNIITGIWDGICGAKDWLFDKIGGFADGIVDGFMDALDIHSPSRIMRDLIGTNLVKGIGVGIDVETPNLISDVDTNMNDLVARMKGTVDYETARTTAGVVASRNKITGQSTTDNNDDKSSNKNITIQVPVNLNGREIAYATAPYMDTELGNISTAKGRGGS